MHVRPGRRRGERPIAGVNLYFITLYNHHQWHHRRVIGGESSDVMLAFFGKMPRYRKWCR